MSFPCAVEHMTNYELRFLVLDAQLALLAERKYGLFPVGVADIVARRVIVID